MKEATLSDILYDDREQEIECLDSILRNIRRLEKIIQQSINTTKQEKS